MAERDAKGRFVKGHTISRGNNGGRPPRKREERYYEITVGACTFENWEGIVKKAVQQALRGDNVARKWLSDFLVGVPEQPHKIDAELIVNFISNVIDDDL